MPNIQDRNSELPGNLKQDFWSRRDTLIAQTMAIGLHMNIYNLRAFWPFSVSRVAGTVADISTNGLDLTASGAGVVQTTLSNSLTPICTFNGAALLSRAYGTEWSSGGAITEGGWIYPTTVPVAAQGIIGRYRSDGANERSHLLYYTVGQIMSFNLSVDGTAVVLVNGPAIPLNTWTHVLARFIPSTSIALYYNGRQVAINTTAIPAGWFTGGTKFFTVGGYNLAPGYFTGSMGYMNYAVGAINDGQIFSVFEGSRAAFGV